MAQLNQVSGIITEKNYVDCKQYYFSVPMPKDNFEWMGANEVNFMRKFFGNELGTYKAVTNILIF